MHKDKPAIKMMPAAELKLALNSDEIVDVSEVSALFSVSVRKSCRKGIKPGNKLIKRNIYLFY